MILLREKHQPFFMLKESITEGPWSVDLSEAKTTDGVKLFRSKEIQQAIEDCVNDNIPWGCRGGCI